MLAIDGHPACILPGLVVWIGCVSQAGGITWVCTLPFYKSRSCDENRIGRTM
jgi:hypothetical protein